RFVDRGDGFSAVGNAIVDVAAADHRHAAEPERGYLEVVAKRAIFHLTSPPFPPERFAARRISLAIVAALNGWAITPSALPAIADRTLLSVVAPVIKRTIASLLASRILASTSNPESPGISMS